MLRRTSVVITTTGASGLTAVVTGEQADHRDAVTSHQIAVLLIRQCFDRRRVERPLTVLDRFGDRMLGDNGLAAPGRCGDENGFARIERGDRFDLETIEDEVVVEARRVAVHVRQRSLLRACAPGGEPRSGQR